jgi:hypothetical protein
MRFTESLPMLLPVFLLLLTSSCTKTFEAKLAAGQEKQEVTCTLRPDTDLPKFVAPQNVGSDMKILMLDLTQYLYNPALSLECEY